jgi:hypothetical protein
MKKYFRLTIAVLCFLPSFASAQYCVAPHVTPCSGTDHINDFGLYGIGPMLNNFSSACQSVNGNAYTIYSPFAHTTTLQAGQSHNLYVTTAANNNISIWIDYDHNNQFDSYEWTEIASSTTPNVSVYASILVPTTALTGQTGMRVRSRLTGNPNGDIDACTTFGSGETEDYTIDIVAGPLNDLFANAQLIPDGTTCITTPGNLANCTQDILFFTCNGFSQSYPEVWYQFVPDSSVVEIVATGIGAVLPIISLWENLNTFINCGIAAPSGNGQARINATGLVPGNTYYIAVSQDGNPFDFDFDICVINKKSTLADVTIDLDITPAVIAGIYQGGSPDIVGSFNGFNPSAADDMYLLGGNNFRKTYTTFGQGDTISFSFRINHNWTTFEATSSRTYIVNDGDTLKCVWDSASFTVVDVTVKRPISFRVNMSNETVSPNGVFMVGNFNNYDYDSTAMTPIGNGIYEAVVDLDTASFVKYRFVNGTNSTFTETVPAACGLNNTGGFYERFLDVPENADTLATVCFNECSNCIGYSAITFQVDLNGFLPVSSNGVHLAGNFNNWDYSANAMTPIGGNVFEIVLNLDTTTSIRYKYVNGNTASDVEVVPAACGIIQGSGGYKRFFDVTESSVTLPKACFSLCSSGICALGLNETTSTESQISFSELSNQILLTVAANTIERIEVYSITGNLMHNSGNIKLTKGSSYSIDAHAFAEGIYFVSLVGENHKQTKKLLLTR